MNSPTISVVIPVFNAEQYVADAIRSVLEQTLQVAEIIVVDDGSTDGSAAAIAEFGEVRYEYQSNAGAGPARNRGVATASGSLLAFLDADDVWVTSKLEKQVAVLRAEPGVEAVFGHAEQVVLNGNAGRRVFPDSSRCVLPAHLPSAMLIQREAFDRVGGYCSEWALGEVVEWYSRAVDAGLSIRMLPDIVYRRRIHGENLGIRQRDQQDQYLGLVRKVLHQRRGKH